MVRKQHTIAWLWDSLEEKATGEPVLEASCPSASDRQGSAYEVMNGSLSEYTVMSGTH